MSLTVLLLYMPARTYDFVDYDDDITVYDNPRVLAGLTPEGFLWAWKATDTGNWHPVTWWSHQLDATLFARNAGGHHLASIGLHALNAALSFWLLRSLTGVFIAPLLGAALFALHPLRVESVAWVAERKDVLSAAFWLLATMAYVRWVRRPSTVRYVAVALLMLLGLMSKSMLVTLPFTLLLLDLWPLGRVRGPGRVAPSRLLLEKAPLFLLAAAASAAAFLTQKAGGAVAGLETLSVTRRLATAVHAYGWYLAKTVWPSGLSNPYLPPLGGWSATQVAAGAVVVAAGSTAAALFVRRRPWVTVGWFWYLGTLVPVVGLVQIGPQTMADRYSYVPLMGIALILAWEATRAGGRSARARTLVAVGALALVVALCTATRGQLAHWRDSETLFARTLAVDPRNFLAHNNLGLRRARQQRWEEAAAHYRQALASWPGYGHARFNLGIALERLGRPAEALREFELAAPLLTEPREAAESHVRLATLLHALGRDQEVTAHLARAVALDPGNDVAAFDLGTLRLFEGRNEEAAALLAGVAGRTPGNWDARANLGYALLRLGRAAEAAAQFEAAARLRPDDPRARYDYGLALRRVGREREALGEFQEALRLRPGFAPAREALEAR